MSVAPTGVAADRTFASLALGWNWVLCVCGRRLGTQSRPVQVSVTPSAAAQLAVVCRHCKREVFLTVR